MLRSLSLLLVPALVMAAPAPKVLSPELAVQRMLEAFNAHDLEAFMACFGEGLVVGQVPAGEPGPRTKSWLRELYAERFKTNPDLHASAAAQIVNGGIVVQKERIKGRAGQKGSLDVVVIYQVKAGKIVGMWEAG
jgi:hypothetical protein